MIEPTDVDVATSAHVGQTYPQRREYLALGRRYDRLWEHSRTSDVRGRRREIADLCLRMAAISAGRGDQYRVALCQRRAYLHLAGDEDKVYSGADALLWKAKTLRILDGAEIGMGAVLPDGRRRILLGVLTAGGTEVPGPGVPRLTPLRAVEGTNTRRTRTWSAWRV
jgi:hypothetical protein